jgi:sec-independent protein translocase protein TatA
MGRIGFQELLVILLILLLLFGANKLPQLGRSIGEALKNFKKGLKEGSSNEEDKKEKKDEHN